MKRVLISPETNSDFELLLKIVEKMGFPVQVFTEEEMEDWGLVLAMKETEDEGYVPRERIMEILKNNGE